MNSPEQINLRKVSISRIKQEMKDVSYLSDDLVITALDAGPMRRPSTLHPSTASRPW